MVDKTKRKFGGDVGTCWTLFFSSGRVAVHAAATIRRINKDSSVLMPGTAVLVEKDVVSLTWKSEVQQASIVKFFYGGDRRPLFGPAGKFQPWHAEVQKASRSNAEAAASSAKGPSLWQATNSYPSLPAHLGHCQFDRMSCWGGGTQQALAQEGFIYVQGFVPEIIVRPAREAIETRFGAVCESFTHGHAVSDLRHVGQVPSDAWTKKPDRDPVFLNPHGEEQRWGCATSIGYQGTSGLGGGQALSHQIYAKVPEVAAVQHYCRQLIAALEGCSPWELCWKPEGASVKGDNSPDAALHRDELDEARLQCVCLLTQGAFVGCPGSHSLLHRASDTSTGHYHTTEEFEQRLHRDAPPITFAAGPGDLFIFRGGTFVHGSPAIMEGHPSPRICTYSSWWPPGTPKGLKHTAKKCSCVRPY